MICPECNGRGESIYYIETHRDENSVTVEQRKGICRTCNGSGEKKLTNADRIRAMSNEELAVGIKKIFIGKSPWCDHHCKLDDENNCSGCLLEWLKQPAEVKENA